MKLSTALSMTPSLGAFLVSFSLTLAGEQHAAATMSHCELLCIYFVLGVLQKGRTAVIETQPTVVAAAGGEAQLNCQLLQSKEVLQVTWQKVLRDGEKNLGTYNKYSGQTVNPEFADKMEFRYTGLQNCSIVVRNMTEQDEGCYRCLFNTYPEGALTATTCLQVYELHEPVLRVGESDSSAESLVSCSATGRPAPTVTLNVTQQHLHFSHHNTVSVNNNNGTVTVTTTAVLSGFHGNGTQVSCAARLLSGPQMETVLMIPEVKLTEDSYEKLESDKSESDPTWIIVLVVMMVACGAVVVIISAVIKRRSLNRSVSA
ncbi:poliovirus receptor-related protein 1-like isoform X3 [Stegastes partitus]|uniref:Poliovirus receptor-related protein 1-like isoform X2 n=1 Tax=Stegastes partitus TaxID=144197 RepID=A0A9Y4MX33_9TELE|nr:PREDICTED: poliovirus receptor-related protein 1-like isoform X2 [Stegastes partitus]XP_008285537.1 PREDICTED: poliovirus receptor-related protein 1-like isoform X3 [Stegastes partitus]